MHRQTADSSRAEIARLVDKFAGERNLAQSEADVRAGYVDLLFLALGWNVYNDQAQMTNYRREGYVRGAGYVDVGLELRGQPVLFLEAKRFGRIPASSQRSGDRTVEEKQAFRYARGKKITYAVLSNFERLHIFNADHERLIYAFDHPQDYLKNFEALWRLSPVEVERGSLPWWEAQLEKKDVDLEFLAALRRWRLKLANAIREHNVSNPRLLREDGSFEFDRLMAAVQRILDRLILIRFGDDKEVLLAHDLLDTMLTDYRNRGAYVRPDHLMRAFADLTQMMDQHHNTTIFAPGHVCEDVAIPNETLAQVVEEMNGISFRKFTSDILGSTYESYLGSKLALHNGHIQEEERRDIRKGRGIYYTPRWVVEYIVDSTLGRRLKELEGEHGLHAIEKVRGLAVLDPACGSGSFLIYAYKVLADFYRRLNENIAQEQARLVSKATQLSLLEHLEEIRHSPQPVADYPDVILREHLFGVDLDPEAAEIAAVNLTMQAFADSRNKRLPLILNENIKVGNSLISGGEAELKPYFGDAWQEKHPFNWEQEFPDALGRGGFDVVISNPPYVSFGLRGADRAEEHWGQYLREKYPNSAEYKLSTYALFVDRGIQMGRDAGYLGYVLPDSFLLGRYFSKLRRYILNTCAIKEIMLFEEDFWPGGTVGLPTILICERASGDVFRRENRVVVTRCKGVRELESGAFVGRASYEQGYFEAQPHSRFRLFFDLASKRLVRKVDQNSLNLGALVSFASGLIGKGGKGQIISGRQLGKEWMPGLHSGSEISRYETRYQGGFVLYDVSKLHSGFMDAKYFEPKILMRQTGDTIVAAYDEDNLLCLNNLHVGNSLNGDYDLRYVVGILNSKLMGRYYHLISLELGRAMAQTDIETIERLPIRHIDFTHPEEKAMHDRLVDFVERMLELHRLKTERGLSQTERQDIHRLTAQTDEEIDALVYDLYRLTGEERRLVEEGSSR